MSQSSSSSIPKGQIATFYEQHHSRGRYEYLFGDRRRRDLLVQLIGRGNRVLDVGCRSGNLTKYYSADNKVVGVDVDRRALEIVRESLGLKAEWVDVDSEALPFEDNSFDVVVCTEVMEHLRFPDNALAEIARVLRSGGRFIGSVPNAFRLRNRLRFLVGKPIEQDPSHLRSYSVELLRRALERDFGDIEIHPVSGHLLGGGKTGIPVFGWLPFPVRALYCLDLVFVAQARRPAALAA